MNTSEIKIGLTTSIKGVQLKEKILPYRDNIFFYTHYDEQKFGIIKYVSQDFSWLITSWKNKEFAKFDYRKNSTTCGFYIKAGLSYKYHDIDIFQFSDEKIFNMLKYFPMPTDICGKYNRICNFSSTKNLASTIKQQENDPFEVPVSRFAGITSGTGF